jgi:hypothetical protein
MRKSARSPNNNLKWLRILLFFKNKMKLRLRHALRHALCLNAQLNNRYLHQDGSVFIKDIVQIRNGFDTRGQSYKSSCILRKIYKCILRQDYKRQSKNYLIKMAGH